MRLTAEIPDIDEKVVIDLDHSASMDDISGNISSHFKNLTVNYSVSGKNWTASMLTASASKIDGLKDFKCIEKFGAITHKVTEIASDTSKMNG